MDEELVNILIRAYRHLANGMFYQNHTRPTTSINQLQAEYVNILTKNFVTDVANIQPLDFANNPVESTQFINEWVSTQTHGHIPAVFAQPLQPDSLVVLASTLYFKGIWETEFDLLNDEEAKNYCFTSKEPTVKQIVNGEWCTVDDAHRVKWMQINKQLRSARVPNSPVEWVVDIPMQSEDGLNKVLYIVTADRRIILTQIN